MGAAVIPQHSGRHCVPMDVGVDAGRILGPLQRIVHYSCQPDARVDIIRSGLEDTPYHFDTSSGLSLAGNTQLVADVLTEMRKYGYSPIVSKAEVEARLCFDLLTKRYSDEMSNVSLAIEQRIAA